MLYDTLPESVKAVIALAADVAGDNKDISVLHSDDAYKALSDEYKAVCTQTYYDAIKYYQEEHKALQDCSVLNLDCLI